MPAVMNKSTPRRLLDNYNSSLTNRLLSVGMILIVLAIYSYPALRTTAITGDRTLPPVLAPDLSLYLNLSRITTNASGEVLDPYYGVAVPVARMGYLKFRLAFLLFNQLSTLLHGNLWWTSFLWNLFWWGLLCVIAIWFFQEFLPDPSPHVVLAGLALLMLFDFAILKGELIAWIHLSFRSFQNLELPYIRPFFAQVPIPFLLLYLGLQIRALQKGRWWFWTAMGITQFLAFAIFPYATLIMAGTTATGVFGQLLAKGTSVRWRTLSIYTVSCGVADLLFLLHGSSEVARTGAPGQYSLIQIQLSLLPRLIGGMWLLLAALTALVFVVRDSVPEVRWSLVGLGLSTLFLMVGDAFFSETALQVSQHAGYFVPLTATVLLTFLLSTGTRSLPGYGKATRLAIVLLKVFLVANGIVLAQTTFRASLPANKVQAEVTRSLLAEQPQADDLVIARSFFVDDDCSWVHLVTSSHALFCRSAQVLLSPDQNKQIHRFRQALYLYFTGKDSGWVEQVLGDPSAGVEVARLMFLGQFTNNLAERQKGEDAVRHDLIPLLARAEHSDAGVHSFFLRYHRVFVFDGGDRPTFAVSRLKEYLTIQEHKTVGNLVILECIPR